MAVKDILARKSVNKTEIVEYQSSFDFEEFFYELLWNL